MVAENHIKTNSSGLQYQASCCYAGYNAVMGVGGCRGLEGEGASYLA